MICEKFTIYSPIDSGGSCVFRLVFPTPTKITGIENYSIVSMGYCITGEKDYLEFEHETLFPPGDYTFKMTLEEKKEEKKEGKENLPVLILEHEEISNFMLFQSISLLFNCTGYEISHVMNFPVKVVQPSVVPVYKKVRLDIFSSRDKLLSEFQKIREMESGKRYIDLEEIKNLIKDRDMYYQKLMEAEDYIESFLNRSHAKI